MQKRLFHRNVSHLTLRLQNCRAQTMVEFAFLLIVIMTLCAGMLWTSRLLTFEFWAQQEARFLAFEQTWVPYTFRHDANGTLTDDPQGELGNGSFFHRPGLVSSLPVNRSVDNDDGLLELISNAYAAVIGHSESERISEIQDQDAPLMVASNTPSVWKKKTAEWLDSDSVELVNTAYASQLLDARSSIRGGQHLPDRAPNPLPKFFPGDNPMERAFVKGLNTVRFGEKLCTRYANYLSDRGYNPGKLTSAECGKQMNHDFGIHLARNQDWREYFNEYGEQLDWGLDQGEALQIVTEKTIAAHFYSFFDTAVKIAYFSWPVFGVTERLDAMTVVGDSSVTRMLSELRYIGSTAAIGAIDLGIIAAAGEPNATSGDPDTYKSFQDFLVDILHVDAANILPVIGNGFLLNPTYLPVPPTFGPAAGGFFTGPMRAVLSKEEDLVDPLIEESNKLIEVHYNASEGSFAAARRRWNTEGIILTSRFYLVTQPWHIHRREGSGMGSYREKGDQGDDLSEETDEGVLRRRVFGLWLFPTPPSAFLEPVIGALSSVSGGGDLSGVLDVLDVIAAPAEFAKDFFFDNPFIDFVQSMSELPILGELFPAPPELPAVRPDAYPGSIELKNDKMSGQGDRTYNDYIQEQKDHNPDPNPTFH